MLTVRLDDELQDRFMAACKLVRLDKSTLSRICLEAIIEMIERDGRLSSLPLRVSAIAEPKVAEL